MAESMSYSPYDLDPDYQSDENLPMVILNKDEDNYFIWKNEFLNFLRFKRKTGYVDGTVEIPERSSPLYDLWSTNNSRVKCWMMSSVSEKLRDFVLYSETAHKAWEHFRMTFVPCVDLKIYELRGRIASMRQGGGSVGEYFGNWRRAWMELAEYDPVPECVHGGCGCEIAKQVKEAREKEERYGFLMGLNSGLSDVRTQIMLMDPPPSIDRACGLLEQAESMRRRSRR